MIAYKGPASIAANPAKNGDPTYLAYLRGLGLQESQAYSGFAQNQANLNAEYRTGIGDLGRSHEVRAENVGDNFHARGLWRSGEHAIGAARELGDYAAKQAALRSAHARTLAGYQSQLRDSVATLAQQRAEQELALQGRNVASGVK